MKRLFNNSILAFTATAFIAVLGFVNDASAVPSFARKHEMACSSCHSAYPLLNAMGRAYKENGYRFSRDEEAGSAISDFLQLDKGFPISAVVKARPFDKKEGSDHKIRALHEFEVIVAGQIYNNVSVFFELEAEDEDNFEPKFLGRLTWHQSKAFNAQLSYGSVFVADPFDTLSGKRRLTRNRNVVIDQRFGGADNNGRLRDPRQTISIYGRPIDRVFYIAGYSGPAKDTEGVDAANFHGRLAVDVLPDQLTLGAYAVLGDCKAGARNCDIDRDFTRLGLDVQGNFQDFTFYGSYMQAKDDANALDILGNQPEVQNDAWWVGGFYAAQKDGRPWIVPSLRLDCYEKADGALNFTELTANVSYYALENIRLYAEWWKQLDVPTGGAKGGRFTIQIEVGF